MDNFLTFIDVVAKYITIYQIEHAMVGDKKINILLEKVFAEDGVIDLQSVQKFNSRSMQPLRADLSQCCGIETQRSKKGFEILLSGKSKISDEIFEKYRRRDLADSAPIVVVVSPAEVANSTAYTEVTTETFASTQTKRV